MNKINIKLQFSQEDLQDPDLEHIDYNCFQDIFEIPFKKYKILKEDSLDIAFEKIISAFDSEKIDQNEIELFQLVKSAIEKATDYYTSDNQPGEMTVKYAQIVLLSYSNDKIVETKFFDLPEWLYDEAS
ncbi:hypothetical protein N9826_04130 [Flavobacteriaceae bacterium]|nr:hypothetical protein [Flavobacteriaceae bacterium]MDB4240071.1 hypothetical protein [Flavobacteriaceae bacterium]